MKNKINFYYKEEILNKKYEYYESIKDIKKIINYISKELSEKISVSIHIVDNKRMRELNNEHRALNTPTDVLSFPHNEIEGKYLYVGDIFINDDILLEQAQKINSDPLTEFKFLTMHGLLHLIGYDHQNVVDEELMTKKQREIFINLKIREW